MGKRGAHTQAERFQRGPEAREAAAVRPELCDLAVEPLLALEPGSGGNSVPSYGPDGIEAAQQHRERGVGLNEFRHIRKAADLLLLGPDDDFGQQLPPAFVLCGVPRRCEVLVVGEQEASTPSSRIECRTRRSQSGYVGFDPWTSYSRSRPTELTLPTPTTSRGTVSPSGWPSLV